MATPIPLTPALPKPPAPEEPKILMPSFGYHNNILKEEGERLSRQQTYRDLSTVIITPTRSVIHGIPAKIVQSWMGLIKPMNQMVIGPLFIAGKEVGDAYESAIAAIQANPTLSKFRYLLTLEDDVIPQPDGLLKLYESIEGGVDGNKYDVVQGLYWTKGIEGQPMIYGDPRVQPKNFRPQIPWMGPDGTGTVQPASGLGMGFNLFRLSIFEDKRIPRPFFKTLQDWDPNVGTKFMTQDLYFYDKVGAYGFKFAVDTRCRCGHMDKEGEVW